MKAQNYVYAIGYAVSTLSGMLLNVVIGRVLGAAPYGALALARSIFQILILATPLGMDLGLQKYVAGRALDSRSAGLLLRFARLSTQLSSLVAIGLTTASASYIAALYDFEQLGWALVLTSCALPFATDVLVLSALGKARGNLNPYIQAILFGQPAFRAALTCLALWWQADINSVAAANTIGIALSWVVYRSLERTLPVERSGYAEFRHLRPKFLTASIWLGASLAFYGMVRSADLLVVGLFVSAEDLGRYAAIGLMAQMVQALALAVAQGLGPRVASAWREADTKQVQAEIRSGMRQAAPVSLFLFGGVAGFGSEIHIVFGPEFSISTTIAISMSAAYLAGGVLGLAGYGLSMTGHHRAESVLIVLGGLGVLLTSWMGASHYGLEGAAIGSSSVLILTNILRVILVKVRRDIRLPEAWMFLGSIPVFTIAWSSRLTGHYFWGDGLEGTVSGVSIYVLVTLLISACTWQQIKNRASGISFTDRQ